MTHRLVNFVIVVVSICLSFWTGVARGDGFIIIENNPVVRPGHFAFAPLEVTYHRVSVDIDDQVATTRVEQEFYNPNGQRMEGTYLFPLPEGAHIDKFSMDINGKMMEAELLSADKARQIYEDIVRKLKDPALLEYVGRDAFKVRIFPIEPNSRKLIKLQYTQVLKKDSGMSEYLYPLNTEKFSAKPLGEVSIHVNLRCNEPLKSVYCPTHNVEIRRDGDRKAVVGYEEKNVRPDVDFKLMFSQEKNPVGVNLLTYRDGDGDGYFTLLATPGMDAPKNAIQKKDICFVIDTSGSMAGPKLEQAKKALRFCLANLNDGDRFDIIRFSTEAENLFPTLQPADAANVKQAQEFVDAMKPIGGTAIDDALNKAKMLRTADSHAEQTPRPYVIIFLTDGLPTVGETHEDTIVEHVTKDGGNTRIFSFGIGTDVNTHLLDRIANQTKAFSQYVLPDEDIEVKVSNFYSKIKEPVLGNVELSFTGDVKTSALYPGAMPDLFKGETLIAFGKYTGKGAAAVKISGTLNGERREFVSDVNFAEKNVTNEFIPRLWATRRVGWLLDEIRMHGESAELKDEVVRLARENGIVTPYTAYLIVEDEKKRDVPVAARTMRELERDEKVAGEAKATYDSARGGWSGVERSGDRAVANSANAQSLKGGFNLQQSRQEMSLAKPASGPAGVAEPEGYRFARNYAQQARVIRGRSFYQNGNTWTDASIQSEITKNRSIAQKQIAFNSEDYFALLRKYPSAADWLSLGTEVDVLIEGTVYNIR